MNEKWNEDEFIKYSSLMGNKKYIDLAKSAAARDQWIKFITYNNPLVHSMFDLGKSQQLSDDEIYKLIICVLCDKFIYNKDLNK
jgi:hypothetical protein